MACSGACTFVTTGCYDCGPADTVDPASSGHVPAPEVHCVEPTGAGDAFMACLIVELLDPWQAGVRPGELDAAELTRIITRANAVGALATTKVGAIPSLPSAAEAEAFLRDAGGRSD